jgi:hypothetical protein
MLRVAKNGPLQWSFGPTHFTWFLGSGVSEKAFSFSFRFYHSSSCDTVGFQYF